MTFVVARAHQGAPQLVLHFTGLRCERADARMTIGRSLVDLVTTLKELSGLGVGFISLTEALDLTTPTGRAMTGLLAVFAEFEREIIRERVKAGIAHAKSQGRIFGRPKTAALQIDQIRKLKHQGMNHSAIARKLKIGRTSVRRLLTVRLSSKRRAKHSTKNAP